MMQDLALLYADHINELQSRAKTILQKSTADGLVIHAGKALKVFLDDYDYPFKVNPHFKAWLPITNVPHCFLIINGTDKPTLIYNQPIDFWHKVEQVGDEFWCDYFNIEVVNNLQQTKGLLQNKTHYAYLGEDNDMATELGFTQINPEAIVNYFHYHRAYKTTYELECLRLSNAKAVKGHQAAREAFFEGKTEFQINLAYLAASEQTNEETPYGNIIALNENASTLHYMVFDRQQPKERRSFLIDAGATFHGYAADITRTYANQKNTFSTLIKRMHTMQLGIVDKLQAGTNYVDLHASAYHDIAHVLHDFDLLKVTPETAIETGIVSTFFPHGLGHPLGLQTHDIGGFMQDETGTHKPVPTKFSALRVSRTIEANQVFTIEPGIYFIDSLLDTLKHSDKTDMINWKTVDLLKPFGGIRIEDNVIVHNDHNENMTRNLGLK